MCFKKIADFIKMNFKIFQQFGIRNITSTDKE